MEGSNMARSGEKRESERQRARSCGSHGELLLWRPGLAIFCVYRMGPRRKEKGCERER
jgi:hypothetical protein